MNAYLDSSVLLRLVLGEPRRLREWRGYDRRVTSELAHVECLRTLDRLRLEGQLGDEDLAERREAFDRLLEAVEMVELSRTILLRASESFSVVLGTLDAIHLATALAWQADQQAPLLIATHDRQQARAARAHGLRVVGT
ncbi:MAG: type II toxin-antitoxin system VapC family toxin [Planctomycetales bacterium]|nr:type II toxin-antitoxin system VapC family toxin [Planctomycetales bacterium]